MTLSIIIPISETENDWKNLATDIVLSDLDCEVIFSIHSKRRKFIKDHKIFNNSKYTVHLIDGGVGRGKQLNLGASIARGENLWFLHADSRFCSSTVSSLKDVISSSANSLFYFNIKFEDPDLPIMKINQIGANLRSKIFSLPFGDQGFFCSKVMFQKLDGFKENLEFGEDIEFVKECRRKKVLIIPLNANLLTSARKYKEVGWCKNTARNLYLTLQTLLNL